jgi:hypothetical protein
MSRGLGREQLAILRAVASDPDKQWSRFEIQRAAWGPHPAAWRPDSERVYGFTASGRALKNVALWRDDGGARLPNEESNFTRALRSLERRGLLERLHNPKGWMLTPAGLAEAKNLVPAP